MLVMAIMIMPAALATAGLITPVFDYAEGDWEVANPGENAADYNYSDYGECTGYCIVMTNYTLTSDGTYYDSLIWGINFTDVVDGEDGLSQPDCFASGEPFRTIIMINMSNMTETFLGCEDRGNPDTWLPLDDSYDITNGNVSGQYLYWTDDSPDVWLDDSIDGETKECTDENPRTRETDVIFEVNDTTDGEFQCCVFINDNPDLNSCNSTIQNATVSVLHSNALEAGSNTVYVRCYDENGYGDSNDMELLGEDCDVCLNDAVPDFLVFGILVAVALFFGAFLMGSSEFFSKGWYYVILFIAVSLIIWWLQNWLNPC